MKQLSTTIEVYVRLKSQWENEEDRRKDRQDESLI